MQPMVRKRALINRVLGVWGLKLMLVIWGAVGLDFAESPVGFRCAQPNLRLVPLTLRISPVVVGWVECNETQHPDP